MNAFQKLSLPNSSTLDNQQLKSALSEKQKLDSIIAQYPEDNECEKIEFLYDSTGRNTTTNMYSCLSQEIYGKFEYLYNIGANPVQISYYQVSDESGQMELMESEDFIHNEAGELISYIYHEYNSNDGGDFFKVDISHPEPGKINLNYYGWDENSSQWVYVDSGEFSSDLHGNLILVNDMINGSYKYDYTYDDAERIISKKIYVWSEEDELWSSIGKYEYQYSEYSIIERNYSVTYPGEIYELVGSMEYVFDAYGNFVEELFASMEYGFDAFGNPVVELRTKERNEYTYNNSFAFGDLVLPNVFFESEFDNLIYSEYYLPFAVFNHMLIESNYYYSYDGTWDLEEKHHLYYSEFQSVSGANDKFVEKVKIYPNPATDFIYIDTSLPAAVEILNMQGSQLMKIIASSAKTKIDLSSIPPGVYLLKMDSEKSNSSFKFIKL